MKKLVLVVVVLGVIAAVGRASESAEPLAKYFPLEAAPDYHKPVLENEFVLVLDVSIPAGATVPAHVHPWPAVFITLQPGHLVFRNLAAQVVREVRPSESVLARPKVEWREPDCRARVGHQRGHDGDARAADRAEDARAMMEFWFEFGSTYSYPCALRIEELAHASGVELAWRPFLLGPIFSDQGWNDSPFNIYPDKGRYMWRDLERICADLRIPLQRPSKFPRNGLLAARIACWFQDEPWLPEFARQVYLANFAHDRDISDPREVGAILDGIHPSPDALEVAESAEAKQKLRDQTEHARRRGVFGAPTFLVGNEMFWGNDRLESALAWAAKSAD